MYKKYGSHPPWNPIRFPLKMQTGQRRDFTRRFFMEIERKFLISKLPENLHQYPFHELEQAYLCTDPVVRIRRSDDSYYLTYKSRGLLAREEANLPLHAEGYAHLLTKADGTVIRKKRYLLPLPKGYPSQLVIELDVFEAPFQGLVLAEVEFSSEEQALAFTPPAWFGQDVTFSKKYHNSRLSCLGGIQEL
jgi:adenylate cyclase